jgi:hypothetical protein
MLTFAVSYFFSPPRVDGSAMLTLLLALVSQVSFWLVVVCLLLLFVCCCLLLFLRIIRSKAKCCRNLSSILMIRSLVGLTTDGKIGRLAYGGSRLLKPLLLVERPYKAANGATIKAWDDIAIQLRNEKHPET